MKNARIQKETKEFSSRSYGWVEGVFNCLSFLSEGRREVVLQFIKFKFGKTSDVEKLFGGPELHLTRNFSTVKSFLQKTKKLIFLVLPILALDKDNP